MRAFAIELRARYSGYDNSAGNTNFGDFLEHIANSFRATGRIFDDDASTGNVWGATSGSIIVAQATDGSLWYLRADNNVPSNIVQGPRLYRSGSGASSITTQQAAQEALKTLESAIIAKDNIRANLGALQNRLENTITNLTIQRENIVAAESRISDIDVAFEMTSFINLQIRTQAALTMLSQANIVPQMALSLLGG